MEEAAKYLATPPLLRPLNPAEHRENKQLSDALTQAKIALNDRHAEIRMMRVAVDVLTTRALKAEARVKEQAAELAEQERNKMTLLVKLCSRAKEHEGRVDCPSCNSSLAWDEAWTGNNQCKHCGYAGNLDA